MYKVSTKNSGRKRKKNCRVPSGALGKGALCRVSSKGHSVKTLFADCLYPGTRQTFFFKFLEIISLPSTVPSDTRQTFLKKNLTIKIFRKITKIFAGCGVGDTRQN
jgi:hypothetical protein